MSDTATSLESAFCCATRYPILLVHGVGVRDGGRHLIWGRIPDALEKRGAKVYFGEHDAWGTPENNAVQLLERLPAVLADSGATKVNIIAHSKGGVDARHLIAFFSPDELPIASLTTIATPHLGSRSLEVLLMTILPVLMATAGVTNRLYSVLGDEHPDFLGTCRHLTTSYMRGFNAGQPDLSPVYSQQFASSLHGFLDDPLSLASYAVISLIEGPNDGLVAVESAGYDNYLGECCTAVGRGVAHARLIDAARRPFSKRTPPGTTRMGHRHGTSWLGPQKNGTEGLSQNHNVAQLYPQNPNTAQLAQQSPDPARLDPQNPAPESVDSLENVPPQCSDCIPLQCGDILDFYIALVADLKNRGY